MGASTKQDVDSHGVGAKLDRLEHILHHVLSILQLHVFHIPNSATQVAAPERHGEHVAHSCDHECTAHHEWNPYAEPFCPEETHAMHKGDFRSLPTCSWHSLWEPFDAFGVADDICQSDTDSSSQLPIDSELEVVELSLPERRVATGMVSLDFGSVRKNYMGDGKGIKNYDERKWYKIASASCAANAEVTTLWGEAEIQHWMQETARASYMFCMEKADDGHSKEECLLARGRFLQEKWVAVQHHIPASMHCALLSILQDDQG